MGYGIIDESTPAQLTNLAELGGSSAERLLQYGGRPEACRPWRGKDGGKYLQLNANGPPTLVGNSVNGLLRREDWLAIDEAVVKAARSRLKAVADLEDEGLTYTVPNGLGRTSLVTETVSDINEAEISMSGLRQSQADRPVFGASSLPLPVIYKDFQFDLRQLMASRNGGSPLDVTMAELAGRMVAELVEKLYLGTQSSYTFAGGTIYGLTNFNSALAYTMAVPTGSNGTSTLNDVLAMKKALQAAKHYGPYRLYASLDWDQYLDNDYKATYNATTLRQRLAMIKDIKSVDTLDYLPNKTMALVQMTRDTVRLVSGMELSTIQWETNGGMLQHFKVLCIKIPQLRADFNGNCGINIGTHA